LWRAAIGFWRNAPQLGEKADGASKEKPAAVRRRAVVRALWGVGGARGRILAGGSILSITS
jgi:hypothetical protein